MVLNFWQRAGEAIAVAGLLAVTLGACNDSDSGGEAADGRVQVVATFYPLFEAAQRVGGDRVAATNLTAAGAEPHDLELTSGQVDDIEDAEVVLVLGGGFQPAVEQAVERAEGRVVNFVDDERVLADTPGAGTDPHVWLDPLLMRRIAEEVRAALVEVDEPGRQTYEANAAAYMAELDELDHSFQEGLSNCQRRTIVTSHDAFGHLARRYGLVQEAIAGVSPEGEPEPQRLAALADKVEAEGITTIFTETLVSPQVGEALAREANVATAVLNPVEGLTAAELDAGKSYRSVMLDNLAAIRSALGCP